MNIKKNFPYIIIIGVVLIGLGFGVFELGKLSKPKQANNTNNPNTEGDQNPSGQSNQFGGRGQMSGRGNFQMIRGTIQSINGQTVVLTASDNTTKNIACSSSTQITKFDNGTRDQITLADLKTGDSISVISSDNTQNPINATRIMAGQLPTGGGRWNGSASNGGSLPSDTPPGTNQN